MVIYADSVFLQNGILDYCVLSLTACLARFRTAKWKVITASCIGGLYSVFCVTTGLPPVMICIIPAAMLWLTFGARGFTYNHFIRAALIVFTYAGLQYSLLQMMKQNSSVSSALLTLAPAFVCFLCKTTSFASATGSKASICQITLRREKQSIDIRALEDTGNLLTDPTSGLPVLVCRWCVLCSLCPELILQKDDFRDAPGLLLKLTQQKTGLRFCLIPYAAIGVEHDVLLAMPVEVLLPWGERRKMMAAFSEAGLSDSSEYDAILGGTV